MPEQKKTTYTSMVILTFLGIVAIVWFFYTAKSAAPPLPKTTMPVVFNAKWDGSVWQIKDWLKKKVRKPDSITVVHWGKVVKQKDGYSVQVRIKTKNVAGSYLISDELFKLDPDGTVLGVEPIKPKAP